mgnify:CR=1 FL=1
MIKRAKLLETVKGNQTLLSYLRKIGDGVPLLVFHESLQGLLEVGLISHTISSNTGMIDYHLTADGKIFLSELN